MTPIQFLEIFLCAVVAGVFGAMLGLGGGIIMVPALIKIMGVEPRVAVAASIMGVIATSSAAAIAYVRDHYTDIRLAMILETFTTVGAIVGATIARYLTGEMVAGFFAALLIYAAFAIARPAKPPGPEDIESDQPVGISGSYFDLVLQKEVPYRVKRIPFGLAASFFAGNVSAILGVGGGLIKVPVMVTRMGVPLRVAVATSNFMIGVTAAATAIPYYLHGDVNPYYAAPCALGVLVGARTGAKLTPKTKSGYLRAAFAVVLLYTAYTMAVRAGII